ncbi:MAG: hypothetical protein Q8Q90_01825 [bacterium]|nr:hypothetical protein [bacterium]
MRHIIGSMTLELCRLIIELDRLFVCNLDGWMPMEKAELEYVKPKKIHRHTKEARIKIFPEHWPVESEIFCKLCKTGNIWSVCEVTIKAPHIHNTEIGGIDITLPIIGSRILIPNETGSPSSDVVTSIILKQNSRTRLCS